MNLANHIVFFNNTATTEIYTLSVHDALPISQHQPAPRRHVGPPRRQGQPSALRPDNGRDPARAGARDPAAGGSARSEEHTSELQSRQYLVCRLLLEQKTLICTCSSRYLHIMP